MGGFVAVAGGSASSTPSLAYAASTNTPDITTAPPGTSISYYVTDTGSPDFGAYGGVLDVEAGDILQYLPLSDTWIKRDQTPKASETTNDSDIPGTTIKDALEFPVSSDKMDVTSLAGDGLTADGDKLEVLYDAGDFGVTSELDTNRYGGTTGADYCTHWGLPFYSAPNVVDSTGFTGINSTITYVEFSATPIAIPAGDYYFAAYRDTGNYVAAFSGGTGIVQEDAVSIKTLSDGYRLWKLTVTTGGTATQLGLSTNLGSEEVRFCNGDPEAARLEMADDAVVTAKIADEAVTAAKIANETITAIKLDADVVDETTISLNEDIANFVTGTSTAHATANTAWGTVFDQTSLGTTVDGLMTAEYDGSSHYYVTPSNSGGGIVLPAGVYVVATSVSLFSIAWGSGVGSAGWTSLGTVNGWYLYKSVQPDAAQVASLAVKAALTFTCRFMTLDADYATKQLSVKVDGTTIQEETILNPDTLTTTQADGAQTLALGWPITPDNWDDNNSGGTVADGKIQTNASGYMRIRAITGLPVSPAQSTTYTIASDHELTQAFFNTGAINFSLVDTITGWWIYSVAVPASTTMSTFEVQATPAETAGIKIFDADETVFTSTYLTANQSNIVNYLEVDQADYTVLDDDGYAYIYVTCGSATRTVTLPTVAANDKRRITIKKVDIGTGLLVIDGEGAETIDGAANHTVCNKDGLLQAQAVNGKWFISVPNGEVYSEIYQVANATATTINTVDVWEQVLNYSTGLICNVAVASSNMTLGVGAGGLFQISASISGVPAAVNKVMEFALSVNDAIQTKTTQSRKFTSATDAGSVSLSGLLQLVDGDVIKVEVRNTTDDGNFTVQNSNVVIHKM